MRVLASFLLSLIFTICSSFQQQDVGETITWSPDAKLTWSDFHKSLTGNSIEASYSVCGINISANPEKVDDHTYLIDVHAFFSKTLSSKTTEKDILTNNVLKHEQGHFDITEWYARKIRKELSEATYTNTDDFFSQVQNIYNKVNSECTAKQKEYDRATNHSMNVKGQERWNKTIADGLAQYANYTDTRIKITLKN
jgi:predicted Zn-dependent protease